MMFNQALRCAFLLALAAGLAGNRAQGFNVVAPVGCGALRQGMVTATANRLPPHTVRGCTCGACCVPAAGFGRATPGRRTRERGCASLRLSMEVDGAPAAEFDLTEQTVEVGAAAVD